MSDKVNIDYEALNREENDEDAEAGAADLPEFDEPDDVGDGEDIVLDLEGGAFDVEEPSGEPAERGEAGAPIGDEPEDAEAEADGEDGGGGYGLLVVAAVVAAVVFVTQVWVDDGGSGGLGQPSDQGVPGV